MTLREWLGWGRAALGGDADAAVDARVLLCAATGLDHARLLIRDDQEPDAEQATHYQRLIERRAEGVPVAYLTGERAFWGLSLQVNDATLIPRPDTEVLVEAALEKGGASAACRVLDLGTGSGAIALSLAMERPGWWLLATDQSPRALATARENARRHGLGNLLFLAGHWLLPLRSDRAFHVSALAFDLIVSNPPYIPADDPHLHRGDPRFEPRSALASGPDGLEDIRLLIAQAPDRLRPDGWLLLEHGHDQGRAVRECFDQAGWRRIETRRDLGGRERVTLAMRPDHAD